MLKLMNEASTVVELMIKHLLNSTNDKVTVSQDEFVTMMKNTDIRPGSISVVSTWTYPKMNQSVMVLPSNVEVLRPYGATLELVGTRIPNPFFDSSIRERQIADGWNTKAKGLGFSVKKAMRWRGTLSADYASVNNLEPASVNPIWNGKGKHIRQHLVQHTGTGEHYLCAYPHNQKNVSGQTGYMDRFFTDLSGRKIDESEYPAIEACIVNEPHDLKTPFMFMIKNTLVVTFDGRVVAIRERLEGK